MAVELELLVNLAGDTVCNPAWAWLNEIRAMIEDGGVASRYTQMGDYPNLIYVEYRGKRFFYASHELVLKDIFP